MNSYIKNKNITIGVCGGIAAYKSAYLVRLLKKHDANVRVIMTQNAKKFVSSLTFEALSNRPVYDSLFENNEGAINHIKWASESDLVVIVPATANIIGKIANGIADDALSTFLLAVKCPVLICPSMNTAMYENRIVQNNLDTLEKEGYFIIEPGSGELACGTTGAGRLPEPEIILDRVIDKLTIKDFQGKKGIVTAGPTWEHIDPIRFISNPSSGKMGYSLAKALKYRGADVVLVTGPTNINMQAEVKTIKVKTAIEMSDAVFSEFENCDLVIKASAVSDYRAKDIRSEKIKKKEEEMLIVFQKNIDILKELGKRKTKQFLVGFAAETQDLEEYAKKKLIEKNLDMIVANLIESKESVFGSDKNKVTIFYKNNGKEILSEMGKDDLSHVILDRIKCLIV
ncbi:MAG: bifunctional phosphopantothenoylcysteine decarboxylase/phosphopantothenate--cysteine ligase CoaBC [Desulfobacterales bacterium]|nr:bifunctional phosphopantothenoylcysteine decarboxylase/phosphopantothenate--cysteine ligase CoaBC [Desulfobacterales bacterium]MBF0395984.1 bifunctional phosphopantothenoylcysteine decarboxylase/phosphopantothenate--cysteine ligase CoaBC [Desulfobacterales bacterium]